MKQSKVLRMIAYCMIPILVFAMITSLLVKEVQKDEIITQKGNEYFQTDQFVRKYMSTVANYANRLIYENEELPTFYDGETQICYIDNNFNSIMVEDFYILIQYKNKAITNLDMNSDTNTIEKIKAFISQNQNAKKVNISAGNIESDSEVIEKKGMKYSRDFENTYYTRTEEKGQFNEIVESVIGSQIEETETTGVKYITTQIEDFEITSSYQEILQITSEEALMKEFLNRYETLGEKAPVILPVCLSAVLLLGIYLILSIGRTKGKDEIELNDLDRIPYEILAVIGYFILGVECLILANIGYGGIVQDINLYISIYTTLYLVAYIICAVLFNTTVKRIKDKTIFQNTITYQAWKLFVKIVKKTSTKTLEIWNQFTESTGLVSKLLMVIVGYVVIAIILLSSFGGFGILFDIGLAIFIFYKIVQRINDFTKIEKHLKAMYEGDNATKLKIADFTNEFEKMVMYINDISNGFENAIQDGIKSEKLKTELITNVSHDIKTPLTSIINYVDLLKKEKIENEKVKEYIEILDNKSQRLKKLTEDLIEASKASSGNVKLNLETINVSELLKQATGEFEDKFKEKNLELVMNLPEEKVLIKADNRYMYRIIENIFSNVSKYSMEYSRLYIDMIENEQTVQIEVKNISKDVLNISEEELMRRFVRGDKSRTTEGSGLRNFDFEKFDRTSKWNICYQN